MSNQTPNLSMPFIMPSQAQKHVTHNEAIEVLDAVVHLALEASATTTPPASASEGQAWGVGASATGAWTGKAGQIAAWRGGGWLFIVPNDGWLAWCKNDTALKVWTGGVWQTLVAVGT